MPESTTVILSFANFLGLVTLVFAIGRFAEKISNLGIKIVEIERKVDECEDTKIDNAVAVAKMSAFKDALDSSNRLIERVLYNGKTGIG